MNTPPVLLLVDDEEQVLRTLVRQLQSEPVSIITANNGADAIQILKDKCIAIIICDQRMPEVTGADVLSAARNLQPDAQRITLTGYSDIKTAMQAINEGGISRFLLKPWSKDTIRQVVHEALEQYNLKQENKRLSDLITKQNGELQSLNKKLLTNARDHESLLLDGWQLQEAILLDHVPDNLKNLDICCCTVPALDLDGDFIFFHKYSETILDFAFGDVMGKGLPAALLGAAMRGYFMRECGRAEALGPEKHTPSAIMTRISGDVAQWLYDSNQFISMLYGRVNTQNNEFIIVDCGSTKPILVRSKKEDLLFLEGNDCPLGVLEAGEEFTEESFLFAEDDLILCYSDGIMEATNEKSQEQFGDQKLCNFLQANKTKESTDIVSSLIGQVRAHVDSSYMLDDFSCIAFRHGRPASNTSSHEEAIVPVKQLINAELNSNLDDLDKLHSLIDSMFHKCPELNNCSQGTEMISLAIHEAFTNIIQHAYQGQADMPVWFDIHQYADYVDVIMLDYGLPFFSEEVPMPDFSQSATGGFGVYMIKEIADEVSYCIDRKARNKLVMSFRLSKQEMACCHKGENNGIIN